MRPGRPEDLSAYLEFARRSVAAGELDALPTGAWLENLLSRLDWETRSRVIERDGRPAAVVLVFERQVTDGIVTRVEAGGDPGPRAQLMEWGLRYSRACGAVAAQVWRGRGHGPELPGLGLRVVRPFLRMDRPTLDALPDAALPAGYRLVTEASGVPDRLWAEAYNISFAEHWRHSPKEDDQVASRRGRPDSGGPELMALTPEGAPAAFVTCAIEFYPDERRQPVGIVATVGTTPEHRRRGLAFALLAEALRRLRTAGARSASLYVDGLNPSRAFEIYARAGFEVGFEYEVWEAGFS